MYKTFFWHKLRDSDLIRDIRLQDPVQQLREEIHRAADLLLGVNRLVEHEVRHNPVLILDDLHGQAQKRIDECFNWDRIVERQIEVNEKVQK